MTHTYSFSLRRISERVTAAAAAIAMTALLTMASDARAEKTSVEATPRVAVQYSNLDLATEQGAADLYRKLKRAARTVCEAYDGKPLEQSIVAQKCFDKSLDNAVYQVDARQLTELHAASKNDLG